MDTITPQENDRFIGKETNLVSLILNYFKYSKTYYLDRINSGTARQLYGNGIIHLAKKGTPDIVGFNKKTGRVVYIECKIGRNKLRPEQAGFAKMVREAKGIYVLARSLSDVLDILEPREPLPF